MKRGSYGPKQYDPAEGDTPDAIREFARLALKDYRISDGTLVVMIPEPKPEHVLYRVEPVSDPENTEMRTRVRTRAHRIPLTAYRIDRNNWSDVMIGYDAEANILVAWHARSGNFADMIRHIRKHRG